MSGSAKTFEKQARARRTLGHLVNGGNIQSAARDLGVTRRTVHRDLASASTQALVGRLLAEREEEMQRLYGKALARVDEALDATRPMPIGKDEHGRTLWEEVPDHDKRLKAVQRFVDLAGLVLRLGPQNDDGRKVTWTYEEHLQTLAQLEESAREQTRAEGESKPRHTADLPSHKTG